MRRWKVEVRMQNVSKMTRWRQEGNLHLVLKRNNIFSSLRENARPYLALVREAKNHWAARPAASVRPEDGEIVRRWRIRIEDEEQAVFAELGGWFPGADLAFLPLGQLQVWLVGIFQGVSAVAFARNFVEVAGLKWGQAGFAPICSEQPTTCARCRVNCLRQN